MDQDFNTGQFITADQAINSLLSREGDIAGMKKLQYKETIKDVFNDLNLVAIKITKRALFTIDNHLHSINFPENYYMFSTISAIGPNGMIEPLVFNGNVKDDIVDVGLDLNCDCGCTDSLCNYQMKYEAISEDVTITMPDSTIQVFTKIIRKRIEEDGSVYVEVTEPVMKYTGSPAVYTSVDIETTPTLLCKLQIKDCGCVIDNDYNRKLWGERASSMQNGLSESIHCEWGLPNPDFYPPAGTYNISDDGRRIIFPHDRFYKKVLVRWYAFQSTKNILIPQVAKEAVLCGIKNINIKYDRTAPKWLKDEWKNNYDNACTVLQSKLSRLMLNEFYEYLFGRNNTRHIYFNNNINHNGGYHFPY